MHTRIDWSCRALGSVSMGSPVSLLPSAGHCEQSQKLCFVSLNSGVEIVTLFSGSVPEPEEGQCTGQGWEMVGLRTQSGHLES